MSTPKPKAPTPIIIKDPGPFKRGIDVPATSTQPDAYQPDKDGVSTRHGNKLFTRHARAQFHADEFMRLILQHGSYLFWSKAAICPCLNPETNQTRINCPDCDSSGYRYSDRMEVRGVLMSMERNQRTEEKFGTWVEGTAQLTVEPQYRPGFRDSFEMRDAVMPHSELLRKGDRNGLRSKLPDNMDSAHYRIVRMTSLIWQPGQPTVVEDPTAPSPRALEEGIHFRITVDGWIEWLPASFDLVQDGEILTAIYEYHPIYLVVSHPHATRDTIAELKRPEQDVQSMPVQATVKLEYLGDVNMPLPSMCEVTQRRRMGNP